MESKSSRTEADVVEITPPSRLEAAQQLRLQRDFQAQVEQRNPSRGASWLSLWGAALLSSYIGVYLTTFTAPDLSGNFSSFGFTQTGLLVFPVLLYSSLVSGAREHFGMRKKQTRRFAVAITFLVAVFIGLLVLQVIDVRYPWWVNNLVAVAIFICFASAPVLRLLTKTTKHRVRESSQPRLSTSARWNTVAIGSASAVLLASSTTPILFSLATISAMVWVMVSIAAPQTVWGLARTGYQWGPIHWTCFGLTVTIMFGASAAVSRLNFVTTTTVIVAGITVFLLMLAASVLPSGDNSRA